MLFDYYYKPTHCMAILNLSIQVTGLSERSNYIKIFIFFIFLSRNIEFIHVYLYYFCKLFDYSYKTTHYMAVLSRSIKKDLSRNIEIIVPSTSNKQPK